MSQYPINPDPASLSLPTDRPFRLIVEVNPVHETATLLMPMNSKRIAVLAGLKRIDISVSIEEAKEVDHE